MDAPDPPTPLHPADLELVRLGISGDPAALSALMKRLECVERTLAILDRKHGRALGAEEVRDLAQDTLLILWRKLETFRGLATLETWCQRFCLHGYRNRLRRRRPTRLADGFEGPATELAPLDDLDDLETALTDLGPPEADVLRLKHFEGLTFAEIGALMGISPNTAKTQYYRGLKWMRARLGPTSREENA